MNQRDYTWLVGAVGGFLNKKNLASVIPDLIAFGEDDINAGLKRRRITRVLTDFDISSGQSALPGNVKDILSLTYPDCGDELTYVSVENFDQTHDTRCRSRFYTVSDDTLLTAPIDPSGSVTLRYSVGICALSSTRKSDWLQCEHPSLRLYAALVHSAPYLRDDERLSTWGQMFERGMEALAADELKKPTKLRADPMLMVGSRHRQPRGYLA